MSPLRKVPFKFLFVQYSLKKVVIGLILNKIVCFLRRKKIINYLFFRWRVRFCRVVRCGSMRLGRRGTISFGFRLNDDSSEEIQMLRRVFSEQYIVNEEDITPRAKALNEGELILTDLKANEIIPTTAIKSRKKDIVKWRIVTAKGQYRYFSENEINTCLLRKNIAKRTKEELNVRNNVESTVFQLGYHYPNDKSRYRGLSKHKIWANLRCLWVNFSRILKFIVQKMSIFVKKVKNTPVFPHFPPNFVETAIAIRTDKNFCYIGRKK